MQIQAAKTPFFIPGPLLRQTHKKWEAQDFLWLLDQAQAMGHKEVLLPPIDFSSVTFARLNKEILSKNLKPVYSISQQSFCLEPQLANGLRQGLSFSVMIYEPLSPAFLEQLQLLESFIGQINFVLLIRKDWNFIDTYKSIPHFLRKNLFIDFPTHLYGDDPFFKPEEIKNVLSELDKSFNDFDVRSYSPHYQLYNEFLDHNIQGVSTPRKLTDKKVLVSIITTEPSVVEKIKNLKIVKDSPENFEVLVTRVAGQKTQVVPQIKGMLVSKLWLHATVDSVDVRESLSQLRNFGATHAGGEFIVFIEPEDEPHLEALLSTVSTRSFDENKVLSMGRGLLFKRQKFLDVGGFDPVYAHFCFDELEMIYKYMGEKKNLLKDSPFTESLLSQVDEFSKAMGAKLFYNQYFDYDLYEKINPIVHEVITSEKTKSFQLLSPKMKYRLIGIKDTYLSLYKATPKVAIEGNIKFWWSLFYSLYYKYVFNAIYPLRKTYYFSKYQYEKRIMGLHSRSDGGQ